MECKAMRTVREVLGYTNVQLMVPFVRTLGEAAEVESCWPAMVCVGGEHDLKLIMMCEIPVERAVGRSVPRIL